MAIAILAMVIIICCPWVIWTEIIRPFFTRENGCYMCKRRVWIWQPKSDISWMHKWCAEERDAAVRNAIRIYNTIQNYPPTWSIDRNKC